MYDRFLGDSNAVYMVVVSLLSSANERMKQLEFWLNFIRTRMVPVEPIGESSLHYTKYSFSALSYEVE